MTVKPVVLRQAAKDDVDDALAFYVAEGEGSAALEFIGELEQAFAHLAQHPAIGSPRHAHELNLPGLRSWLLGRFPYLVFYLEAANHVDVWRVLHTRRDLAAWLAEP